VDFAMSSSAPHTQRRSPFAVMSRGPAWSAIVLYSDAEAGCGINGKAKIRTSPSIPANSRFVGFFSAWARLDIHCASDSLLGS
jgi:hypothetical protein